MREQDVGLYRFDDMRNLVAVLSLVSGILHFVATFEYVGVWAGYAIFFMVVALAQAAYGLAMFFQPWASDRARPNRSGRTALPADRRRGDRRDRAAVDIRAPGHYSDWTPGRRAATDDPA